MFCFFFLWSTVQADPYLQAVLHQLVDVQVRLLDQLQVVAEYPHDPLPLQDKEPLGAIPAVHHRYGLPETAQHLLGTVAVVFLFPGQQGRYKRSEANGGDE